MNKKYFTIGFIVFLVGIFTSFFIWGNLISFFFTCVVVFSVLCFLALLYVEKIVANPNFAKTIEAKVRNARVPNVSEAVKAELINKEKRMRSFVHGFFFTIIFILSIVVLKFYILPPEDKPYFNNSDYSAISNSGVAFDDEITLYTNESEENSSGLFQSPAGGSFKISSSSNKNYKCQFDEFYTPVFIKSGENYSPINNCINSKLESGFQVSNPEFVITFLNVNNTSSFGRTIENEYNLDISIHSKIKNETDTIKIRNKRILKGLALYDLLLLPTEKAKKKNINLIESACFALRGSYILANHKENLDYLTFFPSKNFIESNFIANREIINNIKVEIPSQTSFYVGKDNSQFKMSLCENDISQSKKHRLNFSHHNFFPFSSSIEKVQRGFHQIRFITNHYGQLSKQNLKEGFLFNSSVRNHDDNLFEGTLEYTINKPGVPFTANLSTDYMLNQVTEGNFAIPSKSRKLDWIFKIENFSKNGFELWKVLLYASILYLAFLFTLLFNPSQYVQRIEGILYVLLFSLIVFRFILLWRVATFPPLSGISHHELNTLINFDFNLLGMDTVFPLTFLFPLLFLGIVNYWRSPYKKPSLNVIKSKLENCTNRISKKGILRNIRYSILEYALVMSIGIGVFLLSKFLNVDILQRIFGILYPVFFFITYSKNGFENPSEYYRNNIGILVIARLEKFVFNFQKNPIFWFSIICLGYLFFTDRGFAILFLLFLLLKSVLYNFMRKPFSGSWKQMLFDSNNYWLFALLAFLVYLAFIVYKPLFHFILIYKIWILGVLLVFISAYIYVKNKSFTNLYFVSTLLIAILCFIPYTHGKIDAAVNSPLKHVIYRSSILYQPIEDMIYQQKASSFEERKIYETAESQWFINSYLNKKYDNFDRINLRPHFNGGVNFSTQTRDVVLPRFIISEHGNLVMYLLLFILCIPMVFYFISFSLLDTNTLSIRNENAKAGLPLVLLFSIGLFVWLSSTNRFVFFGQDFPFLSLTSKLSMMLPLVLFGFVVFAKPEKRVINTVNISLSATRFSLLLIPIIAMILISGKSNQLSEDYFVVKLDKAEQTINEKVNAIFNSIQEQNSNINTTGNFSNGLPKDLLLLINKLAEDEEFRAVYKGSNEYVKSLLDIILNRTSLALQIQSPVYLRFDNGRYKFEYNKHLHLELPAYDNKLVWRGDIVQEKQQSKNLELPSVKFNNQRIQLSKLPFAIQDDNVGLCVLPNTWFRENSGSIALVNLANRLNSIPSFAQKYNSKSATSARQDVRGYVVSMKYDDIVLINHDNKNYIVNISPNHSNVFASNYWINGKQKMVYPLGAKYFWIYHFANAMKDAHTVKKDYINNVELTLDYELNAKIQNYLIAQFKEKYKSRNRFKFAVIGADGNGNIRLMNDFIRNKILIDPNNEAEIERLKRQQYFVSINSNERDQWGNVNLMHMGYGPGSSIKPALAAAVSSQANLGWENLQLNYSPAFVIKKGETGPSAYQYAGLKLPTGKGWKEMHSGENGHTDIIRYISTSSNIYHSLFMFLGSYAKSDFENDGQYKMQNVLTTSNDNNKNIFPSITFSGMSYHFLPFKSKRWPKSPLDKNKYFGNENSLLANGLNFNCGVVVDDENKHDKMLYSKIKYNFTNQLYFDTLSNQTIGSAVWSFPEPSYFIQQERTNKEIISNFIEGLKNPTLGGAPWYITPYKMAEMYGKLATQNNLFHLHITPKNIAHQNFNIDSSWSMNRYQNFLAKYIFTGMKEVINSGTAKALKGALGISNNVYNGLHLYAKTGTIGSGGLYDSKRLEIIISKNDLTLGQFDNNKIYTIYFMANEIEDVNFGIYGSLLKEIINSKSFKNYMN